MLLDTFLAFGLGRARGVDVQHVALTSLRHRGAEFVVVLFLSPECTVVYGNYSGSLAMPVLA